MNNESIKLMYPKGTEFKKNGAPKKKPGPKPGRGRVRIKDRPALSREEMKSIAKNLELALLTVKEEIQADGEPKKKPGPKPGRGRVRIKDRPALSREEMKSIAKNLELALLTVKEEIQADRETLRLRESRLKQITDQISKLNGQG